MLDDNISGGERWRRDGRTAAQDFSDPGSAGLRQWPDLAACVAKKKRMRLSHPPRPTLYLSEYYECPIAAGAGVVCHECGSENASMNLVCAYCRVPFMADRIAVVRCEDMPSAQVTWGVFAATLVMPLVGVVAGFRYIASGNPARRCAGRMWLCAALCSSLLYIIALTRWRS